MLIYVGKGAFLPGVPDRDLTDEEVKQYGGEATLIKSGLYEQPKHERATAAKKGEVKDA